MRAMSLLLAGGGSGGRSGRRGGRGERRVDVDEHGTLPVRQGGILGDGLEDRGALVGGDRLLVEDAGAHVEGLRGDLESAGELLEDLRARLLQAPLDLAEVRVRDAGELGELTQRKLGVLSLLPQERAQVMQIRELRAG